MKTILSSVQNLAISIFIIVATTQCFASKSSWKNVISGSTDTLTNNNINNMQISFVPFFGTNGYQTDSVVTNLSINILAGYIHTVKVAEFGGLVNIVRKDAGNCQLAGIGNIVGNNSKGFQGAGIFNTAKTLNGTQIAGNVNYAYMASGLQISGLINHTSKGNPAQITGLVNNSGESAIFQIAGLANNAPVTDNFQIAGLVNNAKNGGKFQISGLVNNADTVSNMQLSGLVNNAGNINDVQIAGLVNNTGNETKVQIAGLINNAPGIKSAQLAGLVNNSGIVQGVQISGLLNYSKYFNGAQISLINIADSCNGVAIGVFNYIKNGYHKLEISADEMFYTNIAFRSGLKKFHTIIIAGIRPDQLNFPLWTYGVGAGSAIQLGENIDLDINLFFQNVVKGSFVENNYLYKVYLGLDKHINHKTSVFLGVTYNFLMTDRGQRYYNEYYSEIAPYTLSTYESRRFNLATWVGFKIGVRFF